MYDYASTAHGLKALLDSRLPAGPYAGRLVTAHFDGRDEDTPPLYRFHRPATACTRSAQSARTLTEVDTVNGRYGLCKVCVPDDRTRTLWREALLLFGAADYVGAAFGHLKQFTAPEARRHLDADSRQHAARWMFPLARHLSDHPAAAACRAKFSVWASDPAHVRARQLLASTSDPGLTAVLGNLTRTLDAAAAFWKVTVTERWLEQMLLDGPLASSRRQHRVAWAALTRPGQRFPWFPEDIGECTQAVWLAQAPVVAAGGEVLVVAGNQQVMQYVLELPSGLRADAVPGMRSGDIAAAAAMCGAGSRDAAFADTLKALAATAC